jgi:hypothetical protein
MHLNVVTPSALAAALHVVSHVEEPQIQGPILPSGRFEFVVSYLDLTTICEIVAIILCGHTAQSDTHHGGSLE